MSMSIGPPHLKRFDASLLFESPCDLIVGRWRKHAQIRSDEIELSFPVIQADNPKINMIMHSDRLTWPAGQQLRLAGSDVDFYHGRAQTSGTRSGGGKD